MTQRRDLLDLVFSPSVLAGLDEQIRAIVAEVVREELARQPDRRLLPLPQAAKELGCTPAALRMRVKRGTVEYRRHGRLLYILVDTTDNGAELL